LALGNVTVIEQGRKKRRGSWNGAAFLSFGERSVFMEKEVG
jgi:hypothetical protein